MIIETMETMSGPVQMETAVPLTSREFELGAIIDAYNRVTEKLKRSHDVLTCEVRRLHEQIQEKDRELARRERLAALGEMAAGVAHEVRNPLGGILLYATCLERDLVEQPKARRQAGQIASAARKLNGIVEDILAFADQNELRIGPVELGGLVQDVVELLRPRWETAKCRVEILHRNETGGAWCDTAGTRDWSKNWSASFVPEGASPCQSGGTGVCTMEPSSEWLGMVIHADGAKLQRVLLNVIGNAIEAARGSVMIRIGLRDAVGGQVGIGVEDDGLGVPEKVRERIFNPFFTTKDSGTGLGLSIVHRIVEMHRGRVSVGDRAGGGAVFTIWLPERPEAE